MQAKKTQPPPRYNEGTLVDAMQNAWRFLKDSALRERLKEAKGIGTPATRAQIITGLKRQGFLGTQGKLVVPTPAGLQLFELLRGAVPTLVDPGMTAVWEMRLDDVVVGKADFRAVIDEIAGEANKLIGILRGHNGATVDLGERISAGFKRGTKRAKGSGVRRAKAGRPFRSNRYGRCQTEDAPSAPRPRLPMQQRWTVGGYARASQPLPRRASSRAAGSRALSALLPTRDYPERPMSSGAKPPTERMVAFAQRLAKDKRAALPKGYDTDFTICRDFLDQHRAVKE